MTPSELSKRICERMKNLDFKVLGRYKDTNDAYLVVYEKGMVLDTFILKDYYLYTAEELFEKYEPCITEKLVRLIEKETTFTEGEAMREATEEEKQSVQDYVDSISVDPLESLKKENENLKRENEELKQQLISLYGDTIIHHSWY